MSTGALRTAPVRQAPPRWRADAVLAGVALVWGTTFVVVKSALWEISTVYFLALRFTIAAACMALLFAPAFRKQGTRAVLSGMRGGFIAGIFLWAGYMLQTYGLKYTTAGKSGFVTGLYIVLVPILSAAIYRRMPQVSEVLGVGVATIGMAMLTLSSPDMSTGISPLVNLSINPGDLLTMGCAVAFAFHLLLLGYYSQREKFEAVALGQILSAAALSALALWLEPPRAVWSGKVLFAVLLTSIFATALAFALQTWGQQYTTATRTALIFALEPVFALITAVAVGGESITGSGLTGALLILGGILLVELKPTVHT